MVVAQCRRTLVFCRTMVVAQYSRGRSCGSFGRGWSSKLKCPKFKGKVGSRPLLAKLAPSPLKSDLPFMMKNARYRMNEEYIGRLQSEKGKGRERERI